jgi:SAM-dependent methyltransferase
MGRFHCCARTGAPDWAAVFTEALTRSAGRRSAWLTPLDQRRADACFFEQHWRDIITGRTPEVAEFLNVERQLAEKIIDDNGYRGVIEAGCADGTLLMPAVVARGLEYLGVDLAPGAVALARLALAVASAPSHRAGTAVEGDIRDLPDLDPVLLPAAPRLVAFPFNVLGNIPTPRVALRAAASCAADILILTYQTSDAAGEVRRAYYRACGFDGDFQHDSRGVHFRADLFTSSVYRQELVVKWLAELGYEVEVDRFAEVGLAYHARRP